MMLAARFGVAGLLLYGWLRLRGMSRPPGREWAGSAAVGGLLLVGGTGAVAWAEQWIPSGLAALIVTIVPVWMVLLDWARPGGRRPTAPVIAGLVLGFAGVALLIGPVELGGGGKMQYLGAAAVLGGTISWATGSVLGAAFPLPSAPRMAAALQMTMGGLLLLILGTVVGEWSRLDPAGVSQRSLMSLVYLIVFGSIVAFAAYVYLLKVSTPARVGSYAYVNPVVAVFLGWALADEPVTLRTLAAAAIIITGVVLIVSRRQPKTLLESGTTGDPEPGALGLSLSDPVDSGDTDLMKRPPPRRRVLLAELERRSVFRASAVYGAASFVILEALRVWAPHIGLPSGALRAIATLVLIGFPVALWLAWHYEITGDGVDRTDDASSGEIRRRAGQPRARRWAPTVLGGIGVLLLAGSAAQIFFS
jgi:drug/metabolite transporter (DMT)-like permease